MIHLRNTNNVSFDPTHYICRENRPCAYILLKTPEVLFCLLLLIVILRFLTVLSILATFCHWFVNVHRTVQGAIEKTTPCRPNNYPFITLFA